MEKVEVYLIPNNNKTGIKSYGLEALRINYFDLYNKFVALGYEDSNFKALEMFSKEDNVLVIEYYQDSILSYNGVIHSIVFIAEKIKKLGFDICDVVMLEVDNENNLQTYEEIVFHNLGNARPDLMVNQKLINLKGDI